MRRFTTRTVLASLAVLAGTSVALGQDLTLTLPGAGVNERALQLVALITILSLAPSILIMVTSFTRIVVVLSLLRSALGTTTAPPNVVMV
ncbi:MAG: flagellar biosynthetic protein FliP, partial [Hyphomicrobiales bacterium]